MKLFIFIFFFLFILTDAKVYIDRVTMCQDHWNFLCYYNADGKLIFMRQNGGTVVPSWMNAGTVGGIFSIGNYHSGEIDIPNGWRKCHFFYYPFLCHIDGREKEEFLKFDKILSIQNLPLYYQQCALLQSLDTALAESVEEAN